MEDARRVVDEIRSRPRAEKTLRVFWVKVSGSRTVFVRNLEAERGDWPVVPFVVERESFRDPNAVMGDIGRVLEGRRGEIEKVRDGLRREHCLDVVLVSKTDLSLADTSSPMLLPEWFPVTPTREIAVSVDDLTWSTRVPLDDPVAEISDVCRVLFDLDIVLLRRLRDSLVEDHNRVHGFRDRVFTGKDFRGELARVDGVLAGIRNPGGYRPTAGRDRTIVGALWFAANGTKPDELAKLGGAVARALGGGGVAEDEPLIGVLNRPTNPIENADDRWGFHFVVAVRSACQLVTAAAHADRYPRYSDVLVRSMSMDLRRFLVAAVATLRRRV